MVKSNFCKASPVKRLELEPRSPWKWKWNLLYFLPFIFTFKQCERLELEPNNTICFYDVVYFLESRDEKLPNNSAVLVTLN